MEVFLWIFVMLFTLKPELALAKLYGDPNHLESNTYNDEASTRLQFHRKFLHIIDDCMQELGLRNEPLTVKRNRTVCIVECLGRKSDIIDRNGNLNPVGYHSFIHDLPLNDTQKVVAPQIVKKCISEIEMNPNKIDDATGCNPIPTRALVCLQMEFRKAQ